MEKIFGKILYNSLLYMMVLILLSMSCSENNDAEPELKDIAEDQIAIFEVIDSTQFLFTPDLFDSIQPTVKKIISQDDIDLYDFSSHVIYLKNDFTSYLDESEFVFTSKPRTYILSQNGNNEYFFYFWPMFLSSIPPGPSISFYPFAEAHDIFSIQYFGGFWELERDQRDNESIKTALQNANIFHAGIDIQIHEVLTHVNSIEFSISITNNDTDALHIFDPDKTGIERFIYYSSGPHLMDTINNVYYYFDNGSSFRDFNNEEFSKDWFTYLESGSTLKRTLEFEKTESISSGKYILLQNFTSPFYLSKSERWYNHARVWIGSIAVRKNINF